MEGRYEFEQTIKETFEPRKLYALMDDLCRAYDHGECNPHIWEELCDVIREKIRGIEAARKQLAG